MLEQSSDGRVLDVLRCHVYCFLVKKSEMVSEVEGLSRSGGHKQVCPVTLDERSPVSLSR